MSLIDPVRHRAALCQVLASVVLVVGTGLPWVYSGERGIDLYEMRRIAHRLEADVDLRLVDPVAVVPLVLAGALLARWAGWRRLSWGLSIAAAAYTGVGAALMIASSLPTGAGVPVAGLGAAALVAVVAIEWAGTRLTSSRATADPTPAVAAPQTSQENDGSR